ncbi:hypothetical protein Pmani_013483 [Petrolisthes manimaculis]|uniref:Endonuclease/exonuclease/phosphatase domain-containing protein n=1 Tax=Petrolisthes manimaculis TaxID=1843537 RepID=A0AAE1PY99_9EUCA|nr:hypothetical protein Pmani_013483 [Petrolisthes manimaculis]
MIHNYDIISLTEIKPNFGCVPDIQTMRFAGYDLFTSDLTTLHTRGTSIYVKSSYQAKQILPDVTEPYADCVWITMKGLNNHNMLLGVIYRSGTPTLANVYDDSLHETITWAASSNYSHKLIMGDFNHPVIAWDPSPALPGNISPCSSHARFLECIRDSYLHQHVFQPTRYRNGHTPNQDDLLFTNEVEMIDQVTVLDPLGASNHIGIMFTVMFGTCQPLPIKTVYNYNKGDYTAMRNLLNDINWEMALHGLSVQDMTDYINQTIIAAIDKTVPIKKVNPLANHRKPLWMNESTLKTVRKKHHARIRYLNTKDGHDYQRYIASRNIATHATRKTRKEFETKLAKESRINNKVFWNYVNSKRKTRVSIPTLRNEAGSLVEKDDEKAEVLNRTYSKVFTREDMNTFPMLNNIVPLSELNVKLTKNRVLKQLQSLKIDKSPGPDQIHP